MERYFELCEETPFSDEVQKQYNPSNERIQHANYKMDLEIAKLKRSLWITQKNKIEDDQAILKQSFIWLLLGFATYVAIVTLNMTAGFYLQDKFDLSSQQSAVYFWGCK